MSNWHCFSGIDPDNGEAIHAPRITTTVDGERVRLQRQLETRSRAAAARKLARLLESECPTVAEAARVDTFGEAARRMGPAHGTEGPKMYGRTPSPVTIADQLQVARHAHRRETLALGLDEGRQLFECVPAVLVHCRLDRGA